MIRNTRANKAPTTTKRDSPMIIENMMVANISSNSNFYTKYN